MQKSTKTIVIVISVIAVILSAAGFIWWHTYQVNALREDLLDKQEEAVLMAQKIQYVQDKLGVSENEKQSLLSQIEELLTEETIVFDAAPIREQILEIGELGTIEYCYTEVGTMDAHAYIKGTDWKVPFSQKTAVVTMDGVLKAGIDVSQIKIDTNEATKTITVTIPEAKILSNELLEETMTVYVEEENLFSNITLADNSNLRLELKAKAKQKALSNDLLEQSRKEAGDVVRCLIEAVPSVKDTYTIKVR